MQVLLHNHPGEKQKAVQALRAFAQDHALPAATVHAIDLALEEHLTNIINYGYSRHAAGTIRVRFTLNRDVFTAVVEDDAREFNPLARPEVDTSGPLEGKPIGGLGIHLMRQHLDRLEYRYKNGRNRLTMHKRVTEELPSQRGTLPPS